MEETDRSQQFAVIMAVIFVFLLMGVLFESFVLPLSVIVAIPFSFLGVFWTLYLTDTNYEFLAVIGTVILIGVVVNNAIVLIDYINHLRRDEGMKKMAAVLKAGELRFRPILMTTSTTVLGLMPMALGIFNLRPIVEGFDQVFRPILPDLVHIAAVGALNVVFPVGQGSEIRAPMAITVIGGLLLSTFVTLVLIPTIYSLSDRKP